MEFRSYMTTMGSVRRHKIFQGVLVLFPIKMSSYFSTSHHYVLCIRRHGADMSQKPTFGCVMSVPLPTRFCTMLATCRLTCRQHVGHDISCLSFRTSGRHADIQHSQLSRPTDCRWITNQQAMERFIVPVVC